MMNHTLFPILAFILLLPLSSARAENAAAMASLKSNMAKWTKYPGAKGLINGSVDKQKKLKPAEAVEKVIEMTKVCKAKDGAELDQKLQQLDKAKNYVKETLKSAEIVSTSAEKIPVAMGTVTDSTVWDSGSTDRQQKLATGASELKTAIASAKMDENSAHLGKAVTEMANNMQKVKNRLQEMQDNGWTTYENIQHCCGTAGEGWSCGMARPKILKEFRNCQEAVKCSDTAASILNQAQTSLESLKEEHENLKSHASNFASITETMSSDMGKLIADTGQAKPAEAKADPAAETAAAPPPAEEKKVEEGAQADGGQVAKSDKEEAPTTKPEKESAKEGNQVAVDEKTADEKEQDVAKAEPDPKSAPKANQDEETVADDSDTKNVDEDTPAPVKKAPVAKRSRRIATDDLTTNDYIMGHFNNDLTPPPSRAKRRLIDGEGFTMSKPKRQRKVDRTPGEMMSCALSGNCD